MHLKIQNYLQFDERKHLLILYLVHSVFVVTGTRDQVLKTQSQKLNATSSVVEISPKYVVVTGEILFIKLV